MLKWDKELLVIWCSPNIAAEVQAYVPITITTRSLCCAHHHYDKLGTKVPGAAFL